MKLDTWMEFTDPDNPGFGPGQRQIRFRTKNRPPVFRTCATRTASGGYTVNLNAKGESYFGTYKDDVNAAIEESLLEAETALLAMANESEWCEGQCATVQGFGDAIVDDASSNVTVTIGAYETGDPVCDPTSAGGVSSGITINAQAPGTPGVDLRPLLESVNLSTVTTAPSIYIDAAEKAIADVLEQFECIATPSGTSVSYTPTPDGYSSPVSISFGYYTVDESLQIAIAIPPDVPGIGNTSEAYISVRLNYISGDLAPGNTVVASGYWIDNPFPPSFAWDDINVNQELAPGLLPSAISFKNDDDPLPREINETIPLVNSPDPQTWNVEPSFNTSPSTRLFSDDAITIAYSYYRELVDPGFRSKCQYNLHYRKRDPSLPLCGEPVYYDLVTLPETRYPPGKAPPCRIKVYESYVPTV